MKLTKEDNDIILNHFYQWNKGVEAHMKMAIDSYIKSIEFIEDDIIFHAIRIKPILDKVCNITEDNVGSSKGKIGNHVSIKLSQFDKPYSDILYAAVREIKLNRIV
jgi:hypothetical protein